MTVYGSVLNAHTDISQCTRVNAQLLGYSQSALVVWLYRFVTDEIGRDFCIIYVELS